MSVISSDLSFVEWRGSFTTEPFKPFTSAVDDQTLDLKRSASLGILKKLFEILSDAHISKCNTCLILFLSYKRKYLTLKLKNQLFC